MAQRAMRGLASLLLLWSPSALLGCAHGSGGDPRNEAFEAIVLQVERATGSAAERPIDARIVDRSGIGDVIASAVTAQRSPQDMADYEVGLTTVGLWPSGQPLVAEYVAVMAEEVVGLYLPSESALFVVGDADESFGEWLDSALAESDAEAQFVLSHELVHLLQHQDHPELFEGEALLGHDDAALAVQAAFEGDALRTGLLALGATLPEPDLFDDVFERLPLESSGALASAPALIRGLIGFPYAQGYRLALSDAEAADGAGDGEDGGDLLLDPPASTEQVLHADARRAEFQVFDLRAARSALPAGAMACELVSENTVGELQLSILFGDLAPGPVDASVWNGWDGDRYLAARCSDGPALLWLTAWDSEADAAEFADAYRAIAGAVAERAGIAGELAIATSGREVTVVSSGLADRAAPIASRVRRERVATLAGLRAAAGTR